MKKIMLLVLLLVFLASCRYIPGQQKEAVTIPDVSIGTQGVEVYSDPTNQREVFEENPFTAIFTLSNLGTFDVEQGTYSIGFEPQYVYLPKQQAQGNFFLRGKSIFNPQGEERQFTLRFDTKTLGPQIERYDSTITFNACYPYVTKAPLITCIDPDITGKVRNKACIPQMQNLPGGQGAPVAVTRMEPKMLPHEREGFIVPEFVLTLKNLGSGEVLDEQLYRDACTGRPLGEDGWNLIRVDADLSETPLVCTPSPIKLKQDRDTRVVCRVQDGIDSRLGTFTTPLTITLRYGYLTTLTTRMAITKP